MNYVRALLCLGLFGWLGWAVLTDGFPDGDGGSSKTRALHGMITTATDKYGTIETGFGLIMVGAFLAIFFLMRQRRAG